MTHIGGSILPSTPSPLQSTFAKGALYVAIEKDRDTHTLRWRHDEHISEIAIHPNGFSCAELGKRIECGEEGAIRDQVAYILACGGLTCHVDHIVNIANILRKSK